MGNKNKMGTQWDTIINIDGTTMRFNQDSSEPIVGIDVGTSMIDLNVT